MFKIFVSLLLITLNSFAVSMNIVATVGTDIITSYDLETRIKLTKILNPDYQKTNQAEKSVVLDRLIQEKLLFNMAKQNNLLLTAEEVEGAIKDVAQSNPNVKNIGKNSPLYQSFIEQIKGEIIFSIILQSRLAGKLNFTEEEIIRFKNSYNVQNDKKINNEQSKQILTSMKINEAQMELLKNLQEHTLTEKK